MKGKCLNWIQDHLPQVHKAQRSDVGRVTVVQQAVHLNQTESIIPVQGTGTVVPIT
jgi:hypothetical protein